MKSTEYFLMRRTLVHNKQTRWSYTYSWTHNGNQMEKYLQFTYLYSFDYINRHIAQSYLMFYGKLGYLEASLEHEYQMTSK